MSAFVTSVVCVMTGVFVTLFLLVSAGILYRFIPGIPPPDVVRRSIGSVVLNIFLPALTFRVLAQAPIDSDLWAVPMVAIVCIIVCASIAWIVYARLLKRRLSAPTIGALIVASTWCNATYLGLPVVSAVVGPDYQRIPMLFDLLAMSPMLFTLGTMICVEYGTRGERHTIGEGLLQAAKLPPLIAAVAGLTVNLLGFDVPSVVMDACTTAGNIVAPAMLFSIGLALRPPQWSIVPMLAPSLVIKLVLAPFIGWLMIGWLISDPIIAKATLLESAMPTMVLTMVFAERYGLDEEILAQAIVFSTVAAMITLPIFAQTI